MYIIVPYIGLSIVTLVFFSLLWHWNVTKNGLNNLLHGWIVGHWMRLFHGNHENYYRFELVNVMIGGFLNLHVFELELKSLTQWLMSQLQRLFLFYGLIEKLQIWTCTFNILYFE